MTNVFILALLGRDQTAAVRSVIRDWSAVGLLYPSVWVDIEQQADTGEVIADGASQAVDLLSWIPRHEDEIRLISLQVLTEPSDAVTLGSVRRLLDILRIPQGTNLINLLAPVDDLTDLAYSAVFDSQINVLVQPVDGRGPQSASEPLSAMSLSYAMHVAAALATAGGLWVGMDAAPFDNERTWSGNGLAAARGYVRRLDATAVLDRLATEVFGDDGTLPVSRSSVGEALGVVPVGAQLAAVEAAAQGVLDKHQAQTRFHPPPQFVPPAVQRVGFVEACRMFISFVGSALVGSPARWVQGVLRRGKDRIESTSTRLMFGEDSRYQVVIGGLGVGADADHADQLDHAARRILGELAPGSEVRPVGAPALWGDVVHTAAALVDGGSPVPGVSLPSQGSSRLIVDDPQRIAVDPAAAPFPARHVGAPEQVGPIATNDPYLALQLYGRVDRELAQLAGRPANAVGEPQRLQALQGARSELATWIASCRSFMWSIGTGLAGELDKARVAQAEILTPQQDLTEDELRVPVAQQRKVRRVVALWIGLIVLVIVVLVVFAAREILSWQQAIGIAVLALIIGLVCAVFSFAGAQRELFQAIHRINIAAARRVWLTAHGPAVSQEVIRLAGLYRQSRCWSSIVAENVHDPFGGAGLTRADDGLPTTLSGELPLSVTFASAHYSPALHEPTVYQSRARLLRQGWLFEQVMARRQSVVADVLRRTGRDLDRRIDTDVELRDGGPLLSYLEGLRDRQLRRDARQKAIGRLVQALAVDGEDRVLPIVRVDAGAMVGDQPWSALTDPVLRPADLLADEGFSAAGVTNRSSRIVRTFWALAPEQAMPEGGLSLRTRPMDDDRQLDRTVIRWDLSRPVAPDEFTYFTNDSSPDSGHVPGTEFGGIIDVPS